MTGSGMQQARKPSRGENRRGGAKPRGRNEAGRVVPSARWQCRGNPVLPGCGRAEVTSVEGRSGHEPQERQGLWRPLGASAPVGSAARDPAAVRTLRRRMHSRGQPRGCGETVRECRRRMACHPEATPRCCPRGPRTGNGRRPGGRREEPTDLLTETGGLVPPLEGGRGDHRRRHRSAPLRRPRRPSRLHGSCPDLFASSP